MTSPQVFGFSREETRALLIIFAFLILVSIPNFVISFRKSRDAQRKADVRTITDSLNNFAQEFGGIPLAIDGKIAACHPEIIDDGKTTIYQPCEWGVDSIGDLKRIPVDPHNSQGTKYLYLSNGKRIQLYASLEGKDEAEYDPKILARNLKCGIKICNFGLSSGNTPLDKSIEEYENELLEKEQK